MERSAEFSADGMYRYRLDRWWGDGPRVAWVMLNPSTADAEIEDPTIRRCIGFTRAWGYDGLTVLNLFPVRSPDPAVIELWLDGEAGDEMWENLIHMLPVLEEAPLVVAAWGAHRAAVPAARFLQGLTGARWHHLGLTAAGHPRHPLYLRRDTVPQPWNG